MIQITRETRIASDTGEVIVGGGACLVGTASTTRAEFPARHYIEYVRPTRGVSGPGPQRIVVGKGGEMYCTADNYKT